MPNKKIIYMFIVLIPIIALITSCSKDSDSGSRVDGYYGYDTSLFAVPSHEGYRSFIPCVFYGDDRFYISVSYENEDPELYDDTHSAIYCVDKDGKIDHTLDFDYLCIPQMIHDDSFVYTSENNLIFMDMDSGETEKVITFDNAGYLFGVYDLNGSYGLVCENTIVLLDKDCNEVSRINDSKLQNVMSVFESDGRYFATVYTYRLSFIELDFDNHSFTTLFDTADLDCNDADIYGKYIINTDGEYKIDPAKMTVEQMADWYNTNVIPPSKAGGDFYCPVDDLRMAECYNYFDGTSEVVLYSYNSQRDYADAKKIVIGGYNVNSDLSMRWAIYEFNCNHDDYRIVIDDYSDGYSASTGSEYASQTAALISYFNDGNAPDIYYGDFFDYDSMAARGMLLDLDSIEDNSYFSLDDITPSVREAMRSGDGIYAVFPAYYFSGYWGLNSIFNGQTEVTYRDLPDYANGISIYGNTWNYNIAYDIIGRDVPELVSLRQSGRLEDEIRDAVEFAVTYGVASDFPLDMITLADKRSVAQGQFLFATGVVNDVWLFADEETEAGAGFDYIGFPSMQGSVHMINPRGITAISADSEYTELCLEFLGYLMSDKVQHINMLNGQLPVDESLIDDMLLYAVDPSGVPEDDPYLMSWVSGREAIPGEIADDLRRAIDSIDTVSGVDWGLYSIIVDEISSYDYQGKSTDEIADSLTSRLEVYIDENYS